MCSHIKGGTKFGKLFALAKRFVKFSNIIKISNALKLKGISKVNRNLVLSQCIFKLNLFGFEFGTKINVGLTLSPLQ